MSHQIFLILDWETRSQADLSLVGAHEYMVDPSTEVLCGAWKLGTFNELASGVLTESWSPFLDSDPPKRLLAAICNPNILIVAHNAAFERGVIRFVLSRLSPKLGLDRIPVERFVCTASFARALALPASLEKCAGAMRLETQKDMAGRKAMLTLSKPDDSGKFNQSLELLKTVIKYCVTDIEAQTGLFLKLAPLSPAERAVWILDQKINDRGFLVDRELVKGALSLIESQEIELREELTRLTEGKVEAATKRDQLLRHLNDLGAGLIDLTKKSVADKIADPTTSPLVKAILEVRQKGSKSSTAKYKAFEARSRSDSRSRENLIYHGASTGRFSGAGVQVQNFPRGTIKMTPDILSAITRGETPNGVKLSDALPSALRSVILPDAGYELFCGDYASIEARQVFWLAGHEEGLRALSIGQDLYVDMAAHIFGKAASEITKDERALGKAAVLGCISGDAEIKTRRGIVALKDLKSGDAVWDGSAFVRHGGLVSRGLRDVMRIGILPLESTPDHWFLLRGVWSTAVELDQESFANGLKSVSETDLSLSPGHDSESALKSVSLSAAYAELKKNYALINLNAEKICFALNVNNLLAGKKAETLDDQVISFLIQNLESVGRLVSIILEKDAKSLVIKTSRGMAVAASSADSSRAGNFWNTLLRSAGLINGGSRWTELITTDTMSPETYESLAKAKIIKTVEVFDILECGPRNQFQAGPLIAHNCGYGMGNKKFKMTCDASNVPVTEELAKVAIETYRSVHAPVVQLWRNVEAAAIAAVRFPGKIFESNRCKFYMQEEFLFIELPSSRRLAYNRPKVKREPTPWGQEKFVLYHMAVDQRPGAPWGWVETGTYGGRLTENICQAVSRDIMVAAMLRLENAGYEILITVHDEIVAQRKIGEGSVAEFEDLMSACPDWALGSAIKVEAWSGPRYKKG